MQPLLSENEIVLFRNLLRQQIGFGYPEGLDREFAFKLQRALANQPHSLSRLLSEISAVPNGQAVQLLKPLLPELLIGETYFWREPDTFEALKTHVLPELAARKAGLFHLIRAWSAACSTGEEVYSLSILLRHFFKNTDWVVSVMGSDLNETALDFARQATYGRNSFRLATDFYPNSFEDLPGGNLRRVKEEFRSNVRFQKLNLASQDYPLPATDTCNYDLIFCRNIFIYFSPELIQQVVDRLYNALNDGGYLIVSPCEYSTRYFQRFEAVQCGTVTLYRKPDSFKPLEFNIPPSLSLQPVAKKPVALELPAPGVSRVSPVKNKTGGKEAELLSKAREEAQSGQITAAIETSLEIIELNQLFAEAYLLMVKLYLELEQPETALDMARRFNYLHPSRPEGFYYLASLHQALGRNRRAAQNYRRLLESLQELRDDSEFEYIPGLSCGNLRRVARQNLAILEGGGN
ncbi:MAG TPA: CheR family methyltransferase [Chloroflexia bacterium]|nr:CheR family methyltransferase [Chloroflexia bacterium]